MKADGNARIAAGDYFSAGLIYLECISLISEDRIWRLRMNSHYDNQVHHVIHSCTLNMSMSFRKMGDLYTSLSYASTAISLEVDNPKGYLRKAQTLFELGNYEACTTCLKCLEELDAANKTGWRSLSAKLEREVKDPVGRRK